MPFKFDEPIMTSVGQPYIHNRYHRNGHPQKSQWVVPPSTEQRIFERSYRDSSEGSSMLWGLLVRNNKALVVGISCAARPPQRPLKISKFNQNLHPLYWHGYPADYRYRHQDRPPIQTLRVWLEARFIGKADMARIRGGKACSL